MMVNVHSVILNRSSPKKIALTAIGPLHLDLSKKCVNCERLRTVVVDKIPCVLCNEWLENRTVNRCSKCSAPQDYNALKGLRFEVCKPIERSKSCGKVLITDPSVCCCYCNLDQEKDRKLLSFDVVRWKNPYLLQHLKSTTISHQPSDPHKTTNKTAVSALLDSDSNPQQQSPHLSSQSNPKSWADLGDSNTVKVVNPSTKTCSNLDCQKSLQQKTHTCPHCSTTQYDSSEDCPHCYWPLPVGKEEEKCLNCDELKATHSITRIPCVLCTQWLDIGTEKCLNCSAPQNYNTLLTSTFKKCSNYPNTCSQQALMVDSKKCFSCKKGDQWTKEGSFSFNEVVWHNPHLMKHLEGKCQQSPFYQPNENNKLSGLSRSNNSTPPIHDCDDDGAGMNENGSNLLTAAGTQKPPTQAHGIQLSGYSKINSGLTKSCYHTIRCRKTIPWNAHICPHCKDRQYESKECCRYCYWPLLLDEKEPCLNCGQLRPLPHQPIEYVPCVLCSWWVKKNEKCSNCSAPQNYDTFRTLTFKTCKNKKSCNRILILDSSTCYSCHQRQFTEGWDDYAEDNEEFYPFKNIVWDNQYLLDHLKDISESCSDSSRSQNQYVAPVIIYTPRTQNPRPNGFCDSDSQDQLCIVFKALVYKEAWGWNESSQIYMRFGEQHYGDFNYDLGPGEITRNDEEFLWCEFQCHFKRSLIQRHISHNYQSAYFLQYKYTVFTGKATKEEVYEFLNGVQTDTSVVDRALVIPFHKPKERIYQYDTLVCPQLKKSDSWSIASWLPAWFQSAQDFADENKLCRISLKSYLGPFKQRILNSEMSSFVDSSKISDQVVRLFHCLRVRHTYKKRDKQVYQTEIKSIKETTLSWIEEVIREFEEKKTLKTLHQQIYGIAAILLISKKLDDFVARALKKAESFLFHIFGSFPSSEPLNDLVNHIKNEESMKSLIVNALENEINRITAAFSNSRYNTSFESVLIVLAGIHVLKGASTSKPPLKFRKELLEKNVLSLRTLLSPQQINFGFVSIVEKLKPFFDVDPLLPTNLLCICPLNDFPSLCDHMELNLILGVMHYNVDETSKQLKENEVSKYITEPLKTVQKRLLLTSTEEHRIDLLEESFENLAKLYLQKLSSSDTYKRSAFLIFCVTYTTFCSLIKDEGVRTKRRDCGVKKWFSNWITSNSIVSSPSFGTKDRGGDNSDKELKVWKFIFNEKSIEDMLKSTPQLKDDWDNLIRCVVESRINRLPGDTAIVDKFISIESKLASEEVLVEIFLAQASIALNRMFDKKQSSVQRYFTGAKSNSFAKLLGKLLLRQYKENEKISLTSVLEWDLWPSFFKLYGNAITSKTEISGWESRCKSALFEFEILCKNIKNRKISFQQVEELEGKIDSVLALCLPNVSSVLPDPSTMQTRIAERRREYMSFITLEEKLFHFIKYLKNVPVKGLDTVVKIQDSDKIHLSKLYSVVGKDGRVQITCYEPVKPLLPHIDVFCQLAHEHSSKLFHHFWKLEVKKIAKADGITFDEVVTLLWSRTLEQITDFISQLKRAKVQLKVLDEKLKEVYEDSLKECSRDIQELCQILAPLLNAKDVCDMTWISEFCEHVNEYWNLCKSKKPANLFASLYKDLKLTGNFSVVETIAKGAYEEKCLEFIDKTLIDAGEFLVSYGNNSDLQDCLNEFVRCSAIVKWIRTLANKDVEKSTQEKDVESTVNDLQNFVNIALATAAGGEGDMATDRLVALRTVGSGFGQLIYQLPQTSDFSTLRDVCISLQKTDQTKTELLSSLKLCEDQIEWFKSIRETQGSVEKTSFGQMRSINSLGVYEIGSIKPVQLMSRTEAVLVHLVKGEGQKESLPKYKYTFDELRDLESKLVLIAGQQSPERKEVDQFLDIFHGACRIADVLMELQHHGNSDYIQWCLQFSCNMPMTAEGEELYDLLKYQAKKMEGHLKMWLDKVKEERSKFNELNYYTTPQLLILREELGKFEASSQHSPSIKAGVINLLYGITDNRDVKFIKERLNEVNSKLPTELEAEEPSNDEDTNPSANQEPAASGDETIEPVPLEASKSKMKRLKSQKKKDDASSGWPKPSLKRADLNEDQEGLLIELEDAGYDELLILLAFETCSKDALEDFMTWCEDQKGKYTYPSTNLGSSDEGSDSEMSSDEDISIDEGLSESHSLAEKDEATNIDQEKPPSIVPSVSLKNTKETQEESPGEDIYEEMETANDEMLDEHFENMIEIIERVPLDENHHDVQILCNELGFNLDKAIEALIRFPEVDCAVAYLNDVVLGEETSEFTTEPLTRQQSVNQSTDQDSKVKELKKMRLERLDKTKKNYMPLPKLGRLLQNISRKSNAMIGQPRCLPDPDIIKSGEFNLVVVPPELVLKTTLSLYMEDQPDGFKPPLPTYEEVLICTEWTTSEEVTLLWKRAFNDPGNKRIFCLVHAELLNYQVCDKSLQELQEQSRGKQGFKIVIVCSNVEEEKSIIIPKLQLCRRSYIGIKSDKMFLEFLTHHFKIDRNNPDVITKGSDVDEDNYRVRILSSTRAGMGKSLYVQHLFDRLCVDIKDECYYVIPIHGPKVDADSLVQTLNTHIDCNYPCIFHIDISQTVLRQMGTLLFNLLILQAVCDSNGQIWRVNPNHLYVIEVTVPPHEDEQAEKICRNTVDFLKILPTTTCNSPNEVLEIFSGDEQSKCSTVLLEIYKKQFESPSFQRTFQYSQKMLKDHNIDAFHYEEEVVGHHKECLQLLLKKSGLKDPSWLELRNFVCFFNEQLERTENSWFCDETLVKDTLCGFKTFIVKFMTIMSKDFCTSSLKKEVAVESGQDVKQLSTVEKNEISDDRKWHTNYHPYLFFNNDAGFMSSLTFVGFYVNDKGDVIDPSVKSVERKEKNPAEKIIVKGAIPKELVERLNENGVNLKENYHKWEKETEIDKIVEVKELQKDKKVKIKEMQIDKIAKVMGISGKPVDPDTSYVLTYDNVIKMLAIQMKFRCNIPVVIMGETGCGKTRLIRYMCTLAAQGGNPQGSSTTLDNMRIMKVHGGTTSDDISKMVEEAETLAMGNKQNYGIDTVLFFDEANTTDAIGLIKEVMCDRRLNGKSISSDLKFIAACNPYRKHHKDMITKLESAGLGFYVKATEAQEKLGEIPLRELVYRVFDLPSSMRPLVYDFGKLDDETEDKYTKQMVTDRCSAVKELEGQTEIIQAVSKVLTWSQSFMKKQTDECSFVSLRDVERALIVFRYFYSKREKFIKLIRAKARENAKLVGHETWALIMSLSVCYHARLQERDKYENEVVKRFISPLDIMEDKTKQQLTKAQFKNEIKWCQEVFLDNMTIGPNIARNAALKENVFMMAICIQLKIPLFLVGKPGSSKSLAKSIIADSLNQQANEFLKDFNEVHMFSYQCSQLSTPESVIEVFTTARKFQEDQTNAKFTSVVVLDEVGLAEDSPNLPLKALHPLLEDGTEKNDQEIIAREKRVAFIGISNWALDPAKMNRGVMVTRADPNCDELVLSAEQICTSDKKKSSSPDIKAENITVDKDVPTVDKDDSKVESDTKNVESSSVEPAGDSKQTPGKNQALEQKNVMNDAMDDERKTDGQDDVNEESVPKDGGDQQAEKSNKNSKEKGIVVKDLLKPSFRNLAEAYLEICKKQDEFKRSFFGLRDFYSLIKMLYAMCKASKQEPTDQQLEHAIKRNFGGYDKFDTYKVFQKHLGIKTSSSSKSLVKSDDLLNPDCSPLGLIVKSLQTKSDGLSHMGESRYLLFLTENNAALQVLQHKLHEAVGLKQQKLAISRTDKQEETRKKEPFVLFGSSFPKDREYTQVCRNINQIKICMETGRTVILLNLENLYESLYDLLNQYHIVLGDSRYVDLGLQTHRVKCRVDNDFKLIVIAERETVYKHFPTPLINRLEKHFVLTETILLNWQSKVLNRLRDWVEKFTNTRRSSYTFSKEDAIVGYQPDTPASVIFQVTKIKKEENKVFSDEELAPVADDVYELSMKLLLQMASPDALIRLQCTALKDQQEQLCQVYFVDQKHDSLTDFVSHQLQENGTTGLSAQITTHSHLLSSLELKAASEVLGFSAEAASHFLLQEFDTELDFTKAVDPIFTATEPKERLLIIQCDSGHLYGDLIACARYRIDDEREKVYQLKKEKSIDCGLTHVIMVVNLPRYVKTHSKKNVMFVGFQGGSWVSAHIDDIHVIEGTGITLNDAMSASISELFYSMPFVEPKEIDPVYAVETFRRLQPESITVSEEIPARQFDQEKIQDSINKFVNDDMVNGIHVDDETTDDASKTTTEEPLATANQDLKKEEIEHTTTDKQLSLDSSLTSSVTGSLLVKQKFFDLKKHVANGKGYTQCIRLHFCIQSVVSMIAERDEMKKIWAAKRVKLLLKLIPKVVEFPLGIETFYGALVWRILDLLKDREKFQHTDWVLNEALNVTSLQSGGTFQNVLAKKIDQVLIPLFANILTFVDCYHNLDLINIKDKMTLDQRLWFRLFNHPAICDFSHLCIPSEKYRSSELQEFLKQDFECRFPFFWVIKEKIDSQIQDYTVGVNDMKQAHSDIYLMMLPTPLAEALCIIPADDEEELNKYCEMYLADFLRSVHNMTRSDTKVDSMEMEILHDAIYAVTKGPEFTDHHCLLSRIIAVHVTFAFHQKEIMWLGQLTSLKPGILPKLKPKTRDCYESKYIDIHLRAVKLALDDLEIPLETTTKHNFPERHCRLQTCQNIISSILEGGASNQLLDLTKQVEQLRFFWNYLRIIKMFVEHIALDYKDFVKYAKRIKIASFSGSSGSRVCKCDCSTWKTFQSIEKPFKSLVQDLTDEYEKKSKKGKYYNTSQLIDVKRRKKACLSEIISTIFFGEAYNKPERKLIAEFIDMVFTEQKEEMNAGLEMVSDAKDKPISDSPSFLLQLLLEYDLEMVMEELEKYFKKNEVAERSRNLLCIQCFEDARGKTVLKDIIESQNDKTKKLEICKVLLKEGTEVLRRSGTGSEVTITVEYLKAVADIRYVCSSMAEILYERKDALTKSEKSLLAELKEVCEDETINDGVSGPGIFLMKQLARKHGVSFLVSMLSSKSTETQWIIPEHLRSTDPGKSLYEDRFLSVYEEEYKCCYDTLVDARLKLSFKGIEDTYKTLTTTGSISMLLAIYQTVTMSYGYTEESSKIPESVKESLLMSFDHTDHYSQPLKDVVKILINCTHWKKLPILKPTVAESEMLDRLLAEVLVHVVTVFLQKKETDIFKPFINFLISPENMKYAYLPTCPGSLLDESIKFAMGGAFSWCPNEDPYFITECNVLKREHKCPKCGILVPPLSEEEILKANKMDTEVTSKHQSDEQQSDELQAAGNTSVAQQSSGESTPTKTESGTEEQKEAFIESNEFMGYILGSPSDQESDTHPKERNLSVPTCGILRALMNACLTWTACTNEGATQGLADLFKSKDDSNEGATLGLADLFKSKDDCPSDLPSFFWEHFKSNIKVLSKVLSKSEDEVCLLLHLVLKKISTRFYPNGPDTKAMSALKKEEDRVKWENSFSRIYIAPVIDGADDIAVARVEEKKKSQSLCVKKELKLLNVFNLLRNKSAEWDDIGRELGVEHNDRQSLLRDVRYVDSGRLEAVLNLWLESARAPTWDQFIAAMKKLKYNDIIDSIIKKPCEPAIPPPADKEKVTSPKAPSADHDSLRQQPPERNPLHYTIYERVDLPRPWQQLWPYRSKVTLETFFHKLNLQWDDDNNPKYPVLYYLCKHELMLNATQYLPDLIRLQESLFKVYNRRIDKVEACKTTIRDFIEKLPKSSKKAAEKQFSAVKLAWNSVKNNLHKYGRINVPDKYKTKSWDINTLPIEYIIPNLKGPGVCTIALLEALVQAHNGFIDNCRLEWRRKRSKENIWAKRQVLVKHVQHCHLVEYQHQLLPMVLSHCHYSLDQHLVYEFDVLEKRFTDRFVHGRPTIKLEILEVKYREFSYSIANVERVVDPKELDTREKIEIMNELKSTPDLRSTLDIVQIIMGFMSMGQYRANMKLSEFVTKYLRMTDQFPSKKGLDHCNLEHVLCLWRILSVELSLRLLRSEQAPFSGLGKKYLQPLKENDQEALRKFLKSVDSIEELLHSLFQFIETFIKHSQDYVKDSWTLIETMVDHADGSLKKYEDTFPEDLTLGQVVAVWKEIAVASQETKVIVD